MLVNMWAGKDIRFFQLYLSLGLLPQEDALRYSLLKPVGKDSTFTMMSSSLSKDSASTSRTDCVCGSFLGTTRKSPACNSEDFLELTHRFSVSQIIKEWSLVTFTDLPLERQTSKSFLGCDNLYRWTSVIGVQSTVPSDLTPTVSNPSTETIPTVSPRKPVAKSAILTKRTSSPFLRGIIVSPDTEKPSLYFAWMVLNFMKVVAGKCCDSSQITVFHCFLATLS